MIRLTARILAACAFVWMAAPAADADMTTCEMTYRLKSWSFFYKNSRGSGRISCSNGQSAAVWIVAHGGGVSFGSSEIVDGKGIFSPVFNISDLYGAYVEAGAHAAAGPAVDARGMTKGNVNLSLSGGGKGVSAGFAFGSFRISPK